MHNSKENLNKEKTSETINNSDELNTYDIKINQLKVQLEKNQKNINDIQLRKLATIENMQKNTHEKIVQIKNIEKEVFFHKILPIIDSFEEILLFSKKNDLQKKPVIQGIALTLKSLLNTMCSFGVQIEGHEKEIFNSNLHHAATIEKSLNIPPNHIISVQKKGLIFNKTLLRKAVVTISKI